MHQRYLSLLCLIIVLKSILIAGLIFTGHIGLGPDEAQYWTWSQLLDLGYYSKPPGIAWEIFLGTYLFGNTEFGVRSMSLLMSSLLPIFIYTAARNCRLNPFQCFLAGSALACSPLGLISSFLAITDWGMILFWTISISYVVCKIENKSHINYLWLGFLILCGALFKWPMYLFWIAIFCYYRHMSWQMISGITISLIALFSSVYWNATHEWSTFRHVFATVKGGHGPIQHGNVLEFIGLQALLISPIVFVLLIFSFWKFFKKWSEVPDSIKFSGMITATILLIGIIASIFTKMQGNWAIFAYPSSFILLGWSISQYGKSYRNWLIGGIVFSALLGAIFCTVKLPFQFSPPHNIGWKELAPALKSAGYDQKNDFLFGDSYQITSLLSFYGPEQKRAYFFNIKGTRKNQFSFWPQMSQEQLGKRGFFVIVERNPKLHRDSSVIIEEYSKELLKYFRKVDFIKIAPLVISDGNVVKGAFIFECTDYNGSQPKQPDIY